MNMTRHDRPLIIWTLYACVLFSLLVCGLHKGQASALSLSGLEGAFCSLGTETAHGDPGSHEQDMPSSTMTCPACSSFCCAVTDNGTGQLLAHVSGRLPAPIIVRSWAQPPPRYLRPSLTPRASPAVLHAV